MLAVATMLLAAAPQAAKAPAPIPPLVLYGVWKGREIAGDVGVRYPTVTFGDTASTLAYEDRHGLSGTMSVRVESIVVRGSEVRFAVKGAQPRFYRGRWDGRKVDGTFASTASGTPPLGTFELTPVVWDDSPRLPMNLVARRSQPSAARPNPTFGRVVFDRDDDRDNEDQVAARIVGYRLAQAAGAPDVLEAMMDEYGRRCSGAAEGTPLYGSSYASSSGGDCDRMVSEMGRIAAAVDRTISQAEDDARRGRVLPGVVRDLRSELSLDEGDWNRATERLKAIESEARKRR